MAFSRVFISLFLLFLSFSVFAAGSAGGDTTTKWYKATRPLNPIFCDVDLSKACIARYGGSPNEVSVTCNDTHYINTYTNASGGNSVYTGYHDIATLTKTCTAPQIFNLNKTTCAGTCVTPPPEPCLDKKDQIKSFSVQCGTFNCPAGSKTVLNGLIVCDKSGGYFTPSTPPSSANFQGCALQAQAVPEFTMNDAIGLNNEVGGQTQAGFCAVEYKYTGSSATGADTPTSTNGTGFNVSYIPAGEGGQCPAGYKPGTRNGINICAPDTDSTAQCPTGQIRNNSGVCVNNADAATDPNNPPTTTNNPDGSVTKTSTSTKVNPDGTVTKTTTKETTNPDGSKSKVSKSVTNNTNNTTTTQTTTTNTSKNGVTQTNVSTTNAPTTNNNTTNNNTTNHTTNNTSTVNPDGSVTDTPSHGSDSSSTQNPDGTSSSEGGGGSCSSGGCSAETSSTCTTPPTCSGDPLVCASINQQWISTCKQTEALTKVTAEQKTVSDDAISSANSAYASAQSSANTQANSFFSTFESSVSNGSQSGSCIPNASLSVMGQSLVIPFSQACEFFKFLRMLIIALSYLAAAKIVFKGVA